MNNNQLYSFEFLPGVEIRAFVDGKEVWFILSDVGHALGVKRYQWRRHAVAVEDLDDEQMYNLYTRDTIHAKPRVTKLFKLKRSFEGLVPTTLVVNEPALYLFIMRSNRPIAKKFQDWVCGEVLPSIRRTGSYSMESFINQENNEFTQNESPIRRAELQDKMRFNLSVTTSEAFLKIEAAFFHNSNDDFITKIREGVHQLMNSLQYSN